MSKLKQLPGSLGHVLAETARRALVRVVANGASGPHVTRYTMYERLAAAARELGLRDDPSTRVLEISGSRPLCEVLGLGRAAITSIDFPAFDLRSLKLADESFDVFVADQVLEHVEADPAVPLRESFRVVRPGGIVVHTTCFVNPVHEDVDLFRFAPRALAMLVDPHGEVIECGGWGNRLVWVVEALGLRYVPVPHAPRNLLHRVATYNEPEWPVVTWVVARKRLRPRNDSVGPFSRPLE